MFYIKVFPKDKKNKPHFWKEGGIFLNESTARYYNLQLFKTYMGKKKLYSKTEVLPVDDNIEKENIQVEFLLGGETVRGKVIAGTSADTLIVKLTNNEVHMALPEKVNYI